MTVELAAQLGLALFLVAVAVILILAVRTRRYRQRLATLATLHGMRRGDAKTQFHVQPMARILDGRTREFSLGDLLVGEDDNGRFYFLRRRLDLYRDQILCFESSESTLVSNFRFTPSRQPWNWRDLFRRGSRNAKHVEQELRWTANRARWADPASLGFGARVVGHVARISGESGSVPLTVEIHDSKILVHSSGSPKGQELDRFFNCALQLRRAILNAQRHAHARAAESRAVTPLSSAAQYEDVRVEVIRGM